MKKIDKGQLISKAITQKYHLAGLCQQACLLVTNSKLDAQQYDHLYKAHESLKEFILAAKKTDL